MDKSSWALLVFMFATMMFYIMQGAAGGMSTAGYIQAIGFSLLTTIALVALASIPVLIYCYFAKVIPDIDYSINAAAIITVVGIITELI